MDGACLCLTLSPTYRLSHDRFTHTTSHCAGGGTAAFWAEPSVTHLEFWQHLPAIGGWQTFLNRGRQGQTQWLTAGEFLLQWSRRPFNGGLTHGDSLRFLTAHNQLLKITQILEYGARRLLLR